MALRMPHLYRRGLVMRFRDHVSLISRIFSESGALKVAVVVGVIYTALDFAFQFVLTAEAQQAVTDFVRDMFGFWPYAAFATLLLIVWLLYKRLIPKVDIVFAENDGRFVSYVDGVRRFRVDCVNNGDQIMADISFRLDYLTAKDGTHKITARKGLQREAAVGPMPLSPDSPKSGYLVEMDETKPDSPIRVLTTGDLASRYVNDPIELPPGTYFLDVSLNPPIGRPCRRRFQVSALSKPTSGRDHFLDSPWELTVKEVR